MTSANTSIITSTALSALMHGVVFAVLWSMVDQVASTGSGLDIELVHAIADRDDSLSQQQKTQSSVEPPAKAVDRARRKSAVKKDIAVIATQDGAQMLVDDEQRVSSQDYMVEDNLPRPELAAVLPAMAQPLKSTDASQHRQSLVDILHRRISANKDYPYLARRQRREGIAKVSFVLQPSGEIQHATLVRSSDSASLDRAALSAVRGIEPVERAAEYIEQAEAFTIDVVFSLI